MKYNLNIKNILLFPFLIFLSTMFMCICYAQISSPVLNVTGELNADTQDGIFITDVNYLENNNANLDESRIDDFIGATLHSSVALSTTSADSSITYNVTIYNSTSDLYGFDKVVYDESFYSNPNITFKLTGLEHLDRLESGSSITFSITFSYLNNVIPSDNKLESYLKFSFKKMYNITYINFDNNTYPDRIFEGENLDVTFNNAPALIKASMADSELVSGTDYTYVDIDGKLTIPNITGNVIIENKDANLSNISIFSWNDVPMFKDYIDDTVSKFKQLKVKYVYHSMNYSSKYFEDNKRIVSKIKSNNMELYDVIGHPEYYNSPASIKEQMDNIYNYNQSVTESETINGVVLDIEPYADATYKTDVITNFGVFANTIEEVYAYAKTKNLKMVVVIPYWYDNYMTKEEYTAEQRAFSESNLRKIIKNCDKVSVMNYYKTKMVDHIDTEIRFAMEYNVGIETITEFSRVSGDDIPKTVTMWAEDKPFRYTNIQWQKIYDKYKYEKCGFSYHHTSPIFEKMGGYKKTYFELLSETDTVLSGLRIHLIFPNGESVGITANKSEVLPTNAQYDVILEGYRLTYLRDEDLGENQVKKVYRAIKQEEEYQMEIYADDIYGISIQGGTLKLINNETGEEINAKYSDTGHYFYVSKIKPEISFKVSFVDAAGEEYEFVSATAKDDSGVAQTISDGNGNIIIPKGIKLSNYYLGPSFIFKNKNEPVKEMYEMEVYPKAWNGTRYSSIKAGTLKLVDVKTNEIVSAPIVGDSNTGYYTNLVVYSNTTYKVYVVDAAGVETEYTVDTFVYKDATNQEITINADADGNINLPSGLPTKMYPKFNMKVKQNNL